MKDLMDHQSHESTDVRFIALYFTLLSGNIHMQPDHVEILNTYPNSSHDDEVMRMARPFILHKLCDKSQLSTIDINDLLLKKQLYGFSDILFKRFDLQRISDGNGYDISIADEIDEELECFYKYISNE